MTVPGNVSIPCAEGSGQSVARLAQGLEVNDIDRDRLDVVNDIVEEAVSSWGIADRVRRLILPSLLYNEVDLQHMRFLLLDDEGGKAVAVAIWEEIGGTDTSSRTRKVQLHGLYVRPRWQRQGLGAGILEFVGLWVGMHGLDGITVRPWRESEAFFRRHGFESASDRASPEDSSPGLWRSSQWMH